VSARLHRSRLQALNPQSFRSANPQSFRSAYERVISSPNAAPAAWRAVRAARPGVSGHQKRPPSHNHVRHLGRFRAAKSWPRDSTRARTKNQSQVGAPGDGHLVHISDLVRGSAHVPIVDQNPDAVRAEANMRRHLYWTTGSTNDLQTARERAARPCHQPRRLF
jgi:hypothetical protein